MLLHRPIAMFTLFHITFVKSLYQEEFEILPSNYSREFHPWTSDKTSFKAETILSGHAGTLNVQIYITILSISRIDEETSSVHMSLLMRSVWTDPRILLPEGLPEDGYLSFSPLLRNRLWVPDLSLIRAYSVRTMELYTPTEAIQVFGNKTVFVGTLFLVEYSCPMTYNYFPLDKQVCEVVIESSGYTMERVNISWHPAGVTLSSGFMQHQFMVDVESGFTQLVQYPSGVYSGVGFRLQLQRKLQFYLLQTYLPSALLVAVAGVSFLVPASAVPGRMVLCITTLLAVTTMFAAERQAGPRVSYIKAMDVWMLGCMVFCFYSTVEYALIIRLGLSQPPQEKSVAAVQSAPAGLRLCCGRVTQVQPLGSCDIRNARDHRQLGQLIEKWSLRVYGLVFVLFNVAYWLFFSHP